MKLIVMISFLTLAGGCISAAAQYRDTGKLNTWTAVNVTRVRSADGQLRIVRAARQDGFDRVVFEFADGVPTFWITYPRPPVYDLHTQAPVKISGTDLLEVSLHFNYGEHIEIYQGFPKGGLDLPMLREIKNVDFSEGVMAFALALQGRHAFRVQILTNPARLVVDLKH